MIEDKHILFENIQNPLDPFGFGSFLELGKCQFLLPYIAKPLQKLHFPKHQSCSIVLLETFFLHLLQSCRVCLGSIKMDSIEYLKFEFVEKKRKKNQEFCFSDSKDLKIIIKKNN